jgi:hypothetical protein
MVSHLRFSLWIIPDLPIIRTESHPMLRVEPTALDAAAADA